MTHVITDSCIRCKYTDCVDVCPVDGFHEGPAFLVINPEECVDCGVCVPECPVNAIYLDADVPEAMKPFLEINRQLAQEWPSISRRKEPLPDAHRWKEATDKLATLKLQA